LTSYLFRRVKKKNRKRYLRYMENLVIHEVGHTLGLDHCPLARCIMADAQGNALRAARLSINEFCPRCTRLLRRHLRDPQVKGKWSKKERAILKKLSSHSIR
jgi:predicted Zn-dependent protease